MQTQVKPTGGEIKRLEIPLPDFPKLDGQLDIKTESGSGTFQILQAYVLSDKADEDYLIRIVERNINSVELEVGPLPDYRILTFLDAAYPGWNAYVDGTAAPILLADDAFKAVVVPPGTHRVEFRFQPVRVYVGAGVSALGLVAALILIVVGRRFRKQHPVDSPV